MMDRAIVSERPKEQTLDRFWEHQIRDQHDLSQHVDYIHYNPVHHQLVKHPFV